MNKHAQIYFNIDGGIWPTLYVGAYGELKNCGCDIVSIYNKFRDTKWESITKLTTQLITAIPYCEVDNLPVHKDINYKYIINLSKNKFTTITAEKGSYQNDKWSVSYSWVWDEDMQKWQGIMLF